LTVDAAPVPVTLFPEIVTPDIVVPELL